MNEKLIKEINGLPFHNDMARSIKTLLRILSNDWKKGLTALKRSQVLINKFGISKTGDQITEVIDLVSKGLPPKHKNRYLKYFSSIIPLNNLLREISKGIIKSEFWLLEKEVCLTSLLARFEAEYAHIDHNIQAQLNDGFEKNHTFHLGKPVFLRTTEGAPIEVDKKFQQLAASLDRNLRFVEYHLKRTPLVNTATSPDLYKAGLPQISGELWNSIFYLIDKVSLFDWYATKTSEKPETLYYQPRNKMEHILKIIGELRESQWLLQQFVDTEDAHRLIKEFITPDDPLAPRNEKELRAYIELCEMCNDDKILNVKFKNELKVKEYIRAWFVISEIARAHFNEKKKVLLETEGKLDLSNLLIISIDSLIESLTEKGKLNRVSAQKSIELLTYWNMDHDIFSSPLFPTTEGQCLILTSIFVSGNPARSVFRLLSHDEIDISFKGISSEKKLGEIFSNMGFNCLTGYKFRDSLGEGDIDCIAFKENTFIVCESKNIVPNESTYDRFRTFQLFSKKASKQANRALRFVNSNLPQICEQLSIKIPNNDAVRISPAIITNLFGFTGYKINAVPVCDFSALGRFVTSKYVYRNIRDKNGISREPVKKLYKGDTPTAAEVLNQLNNPFQVMYIAKSIEITSITQQMTKELILKVFDVRESETTAANF